MLATHIAFARITLRVLVGQDAAGRFDDRWQVKFSGRSFDVRILANSRDGLVNRRIDFGKRSGIDSGGTVCVLDIIG